MLEEHSSELPCQLLVLAAKKPIHSQSTDLPIIVLLLWFCLIYVCPAAHHGISPAWYQLSTCQV